MDLELARKELLSMGMGGARTPVPEEEVRDEEDEDREEERRRTTSADDEDDDVKGNKATGRKSKAARRKEKEEEREMELRRQAERERAAARAEKRRSQADNGQGGDAAEPTPVAQQGGGKKLGCLTCKASFEDTKAHREHFRSDWHRYNLKLKEKGGAPVSEMEFVAVDADEMFRTDR